MRRRIVSRNGGGRAAGVTSAPSLVIDFSNSMTNSGLPAAPATSASRSGPGSASSISATRSRTSSSPRCSTRRCTAPAASRNSISAAANPTVETGGSSRRARPAARPRPGPGWTSVSRLDGSAHCRSSTPITNGRCRTRVSTRSLNASTARKRSPGSLLMVIGPASPCSCVASNAAILARAGSDAAARTQPNASAMTPNGRVCSISLAVARVNLASAGLRHPQHLGQQAGLPDACLTLDENDGQAARRRRAPRRRRACRSRRPGPGERSAALPPWGKCYAVPDLFRSASELSRSSERARNNPSQPENRDRFWPARVRRDRVGHPPKPADRRVCLITANPYSTPAASPPPPAATSASWRIFRSLKGIQRRRTGTRREPESFPGIASSADAPPSDSRPTTSDRTGLPGADTSRVQGCWMPLGSRDRRRCIG